MIEILNPRKIDRGALFGSCDVRIVPWQMTLKDVKIFQKGANRWVSMPSKEYESMGEKKYFELVTFDNAEVAKRFKAQVLEAVEKYLDQNPDLEPPAPIHETAEFPF